MKKRGFASNRAQITIFMILGVVLLFIVVTFIMLTTSLQKEQLKEQQEKVFTAAFYKEGLRLFMEDVLTDELSSALLLMGQQGRIWKDQGGIISHLDNSIVFGDPNFGGRVFLAIKEPEPTEFPESYPCGIDKDASPFCEYAFPMTGEFGSRRNALTKRTVENDIESYLLSAVTLKVEEFIQSTVSPSSEISEGDVVIDVQLLNDGIAVSVEYPLYVSSGSNDFFTLSEFDFFYTSEFTKFITKAVLNPIRWDWTSTEFEYEQALADNSFILNGADISLSLYPEMDIEMDTESLDDGTDIFTFTYPLEAIIQSDPDDVPPLENYVFRIARENRPPALDYINRCPGDGYDYLVVSTVGGLDNVKINMKANDPDEDLNIIYGLGTSSQTFIDGTEEKLFELSPSSILNENNIYNLKASVSDTLAEDFQDVRVKVVANSQCCVVDDTNIQGGKVASAGTICSDSAVEEGCFGGLDELASKGYLLEERTGAGTCNGLTSDCGTDPNAEKVYTSKITCGWSLGLEPDTIPFGGECNRVATGCEGKDPYTLEEDVGWCTGEWGCGSFCGVNADDEIVSFLQPEDDGAPFDWSGRLVNPTDASSFSCRCESVGEGAWCDHDFDGTFDRKCDSIGECSIEI